MASNVTSRLLVLIAEVLELDPQDVKPESHFFNDLGASSLDIAEMIWRIEDDKTFDIGEIPDDVLDNLRVVQDVIDFMEGDAPSDVDASSVMSQQAVTVALSCDHAGFELKNALKHDLAAQGISLVDLGPLTPEAVDYPDYAHSLSLAVLQGRAQHGILICGTGIGMSIAANKIAGIRAACVQDPVSAKMSRLHNNANVLCLGSRIIGLEIARACVEAFLSTDFNPGRDGRHARRLNRIRTLENSP